MHQKSLWDCIFVDSTNVKCTCDWWVLMMKVMTLGSPKGYGSQNKPCALNHPPASSCLLWIGGIPGASVPHRNRGSGSAIDFAALRRGMAMAN